MAKKDERNLNITINNREEDKDSIVISLSQIFRKLKQFIAVWLAASIVAGILTVIAVSFKTMHEKHPVTALVSFSYSGIEKGKDPAGRVFDINSIKNPAVIEDALTQLGMDIEKLEDIRANTTFYGIIPEDAVNRITAYRNIYENASTGNLAAAQAMLDETYYPTKFKVTFDYSAAGFSKSDGVTVLNQLLECYRAYFYDQYGFNNSLGTAISAVSYTDYDYAEQVDVFKTALDTIERYLTQLSKEDSTLFRSNITGYTFNDLLQAAQTVESIDLDRISSYISVNNITKDKTASIAYYDYRIESLTRTQIQTQERLDSLEVSIQNYVKDTILIFGNGTDGNDTSYSQASEEYDKLLERKDSLTAELAAAKQNINYYQSRRDALNSNKNANDSQKKQVEDDLASLSEKLSNLVSLTEQTADEYYADVAFENAYNILVPAVNSAGASMSYVINSAVMPLIMVEALIFVVYVMYAFIRAIADGNRKKKDDDDDDDNEDEDDLEDVIEAIADSADEEKPAEKKNSSQKNSSSKKKRR